MFETGVEEYGTITIIGTIVLALFCLSMIVIIVKLMAVAWRRLFTRPRRRIRKAKVGEVADALDQLKEC